MNTQIRINKTFCAWSTRLKSSVCIGLLVLASTVLAGGAYAATTAPVVFAVDAALSGPNAQYGHNYVRVAKAFADYWNSRGGIDGHRVKVITGDHRDQPSVAISIGRRMIREHHATAFVGFNGSGLTLALTKALSHTHVPMMLNYIWGDSNTSPSLPSVYRIGPYNSYVAKLFARYLVNDTDYRNVVVLAEESAYGVNFASALKRDVAALNGSVALQIIKYQPKVLDLTPVLAKLAHGTQPDAVIVAGNYQIIYNIQNQAPAAGLHSQIIGAWDYPATSQFWDIAKKNGVGTIFATFTGPSSALTDVGQNVRKVLLAKLGREPLFYEYFQWDCMNAVRHAILATHSLKPETLTKALASVRFMGTFGPIAFNTSPSAGDGAFHTAVSGTLYFKKYTRYLEKANDAEVVAAVKASAK